MTLPFAPATSMSYKRDKSLVIW